jgi:hypothetical protein
MTSDDIFFILSPYTDSILLRDDVAYQVPVTTIKRLLPYRKIENEIRRAELTWCVGLHCYLIKIKKKERKKIHGHYEACF